MQWTTFRNISALVVLSFHAVSIFSAASGTITVGPNNIQLFYTDSGAPKGSYTTAFLVHGLTFNGGIFEKVQAIASQSNLRLVAINRRDYRGSTPYSAAELSVISNGTDTERTDFLVARGVEISTFIDKFMQQNNIPLPGRKGDTGSVALISWSAASMMSLSAIANVKALPADVQERLSRRMFSFILHEPSVETFGLPSFVQNYIPLLDTSVPANTTGNLTAQFLSNYFQHGDLSARNPFLLSWVVPSIIHAPSIFGLSCEQYDSVVQISSGANDFAIIFEFPSQLNANYRAALFDPTTRASLPNMSISSFSGVNTAGFGLYARFIMQADNDAAGGSFIKFAPLVNGVNHFVHWDFPTTAITEYSNLIHS